MGWGHSWTNKVVLRLEFLGVAKGHMFILWPLKLCPTRTHRNFAFYTSHTYSTVGNNKECSIWLTYVCLSGTSSRFGRQCDTPDWAKASKSLSDCLLAQCRLYGGGPYLCTIDFNRGQPVCYWNRGVSVDLCRNVYLLTQSRAKSNSIKLTDVEVVTHQSIKCQIQVKGRLINRPLNLERQTWERYTLTKPWCNMRKAKVKMDRELP